jgi:MOSC domain-containing protein YiiM
MQRGTVVEINIGPEFEEPMSPVDEVRAVAGRGLEGDRYFQDEGTPSEERIPANEITLIESEAIEAAQRDRGADFSARDTRRNVVTQGVSLNDVLGRTFRVGEAELEGLEKNPPCAHLDRISNKKILKPLIDGGGIRARIVKSGTIRRGDEVSA